MGNSIAGLPADGAIIDDPFGKREDADSPVVRQRVWDWYANDLYTAAFDRRLDRAHAHPLAPRRPGGPAAAKNGRSQGGPSSVFCDEKRPDMVGIEAEQFQELLVHEFRRQCGGQSTHALAAVQDDDRGMPKIARIRRLSQYVINRELRFKADSPGCRLLVDQLMDFPLAEHDDGPDALEMCTRLPVEVVL